MQPAVAPRKEVGPQLPRERLHFTARRRGRLHEGHNVPIAAAVGERLQHDKVFGGAGQQRKLGQELEHRRPGDHESLVRQATQSDVDADPGRRLQQQHAVPERELLGVGDARGEVPQELVDVPFLAAEAGQQRQVNVLRHARLAPTLQGHAANEAELPTLPLANTLDLLARLEYGDHRARLLNQRCCSTNPEVGNGL